MAETFNTTLLTELKSKLPDINHSMDIFTKFYLTNRLLNYNLILGRDILNELRIIFKFKIKTITWQEVSIYMKPPNCIAKEIVVIKEDRPR